MQTASVCLRARSRLLPCIAKRHLTTPASAEHLPRIAQPSLWSSVIPRFLRRRQAPHDPSHHAATDSSAPPSRFRAWLQNPSTSLIILAMLTGSQAIQVMVLNQEINERRYTARRRIEQLRDVLNRIKNGEQVDLAAELGTGDPQAEAEWKDMIDQIADERFWVLPKLRKDVDAPPSPYAPWEKPPKEQKTMEADGGAESKEASLGQKEGETKFSAWSFWAKTKKDEPVPMDEQAVVANAEPSRRAFY